MRELAQITAHRIQSPVTLVKGKITTAEEGHEQFDESLRQTFFP